MKNWDLNATVPIREDGSWSEPSNKNWDLDKTMPLSSENNMPETIGNYRKDGIASTLMKTFRSNRLSFDEKKTILFDIAQKEAEDNPILLLAASGGAVVFSATAYALSKLPRLSETLGKPIVDAFNEEAEIPVSDLGMLGQIVLGDYQRMGKVGDTIKINPKEDAKAVLDLAQGLGEMVLAGKADKKVAEVVFEDSLKQLGTKLTQAGYGKGKVTLDINKVRKYGRSLTSGEAIRQNIEIRGINPLEQPTAQEALKITSMAKKAQQPIMKEVKGEGVMVTPSPKVVPEMKASEGPVVSQSLIEEAKKYKTAEEFVSFMRGSATQYREYQPEMRANIAITEEAQRMSELGVDPEKEITIYRGVPDPKSNKIVDGDFVTTDYQSAASYAGEDNVVSKEIKAKDLIVEYPDEFSPSNLEGVGYEYIYSDSKNKLIKYSDKQLTDIWKKANEPKVEEPLLTQDDIGKPPEEPPEFPTVKKEFIEQPKKKTNILQYFTPAEYHLKQLGFDAEIGQPIREALQDFSIELANKNELLINIQKEHFSKIPKKDIKASSEKLWEYMDKGIPKGDTSIEAKTARKLRKETKEMLKRINELNKRIGREEVKGVKNYILHMLKPELLNEIYAKGVLPQELAKVMEYIPSKNVFLRTAQQRKGVPDDWLVKEPYQLMKAMYAIDLKYIYLQEALDKVAPYMKAVKEYQGEGQDYWTPETYKYLDDWVKQAVKMRPSNWDTLIDNLLEHTFAPLLRKTGLRVSHMPWRDLVSTLSAAAHTGALGMRVRPILRNLVQSTFDWVMYGTKPYLKASKKFLTKEGQEILKQSKVWKTRVPYEAQDLATLQKIFKIGGLGYRASDLHNVGKGLLTRYYHAIDDLKMTKQEALKFADNDLPATQWSYRREDLPRAYWTTTGRAFWTLGSWWMNFYTRFLPELSRRAFTGFDVSGRKVPTSERLGIMRLFVIIGVLFAVKEKSKELTGTVIDYTGQIKPTPLREAPIAQMMLAFRDTAQGITDNNERKMQEGLRNLSNTAKIFIPWYLAGKDMIDLLTGKKELGEFLFYGSRKKSKGKVYK